MNMEANTLYREGLRHLQVGDTSEALSIFERVLTHPSSQKIAGPIHYNIAVCHQRLGDSEKALEALRKAVNKKGWLAAEARKDPDFSELRNNEEFIEIFNNRNPVLLISISWFCAVFLVVGIILGIRYFIRHQVYEGVQAIGLPVINGLVAAIPLLIGLPGLVSWTVSLLVGPAIGIYFFRWLQDRRARSVPRARIS